MYHTGNNMMTISLKDHNGNINSTGMTATLTTCLSGYGILSGVYTNTSGISFHLETNIHAYHEISGDITQPVNGSGNGIRSIPLLLSGGEGTKHISRKI
jgi:hypothetical protein